MTNDEAIKVMETVMELPKTFQVNGGDLRDAAALAIEALEEKRPHGKWIEHEDGYNICPFCKNKTAFSYLFCPNCGADLRRRRTK